MFWADEIAQGRSWKEWINDAWTPSGMVHMGGLKGPVIHDTLYRILKEQGSEVTWTFGFDDFDPIDGLPPELQQSHNQYLGVPIFLAPSPDGNGSFGKYFSDKMLAYFDVLNIQAQVYYASEYYKKGVYNKAIQFVLEHADGVRKVYEEMYKKPVAKDWYPLQVICPTCGKLGTTRVTSWDGNEVMFVCEPDLVKWAAGCGATGKMNPFSGTAKMPWKVEWAAKWWTFGITIEAAGKDHASAGGSYDVAIKICNDVFKTKPPLKIPYEFFLSGGKKMASSKGIGMNAQELLEVLPPEIARFLMIKTKPNQAVEFTPKGTDIIPILFDEYQRAAEAYFSPKGRSTDEDSARLFKLSQAGAIKKPPSLRFSLLTQWTQMPNMEERIRKERLGEWEQYAKVWITKYAPESERFSVSQALPQKAQKLLSEQKKYLQKISSGLDQQWAAEDFQTQLYEWAKEVPLPSKDAFAAIYICFLGKNYGPKAAWLILSLDKDFVKKRFNAVSTVQEISLT